MYSFKTVLLDMITNQPVIDRSRIKSHITPSVGTELNGGDISKIMGPNLHGWIIIFAMHGELLKIQLTTWIDISAA